MCDKCIKCPLQALLRAGLLPGILTEMLGIMATPTDEDEEEGSESTSPITVAAQVLDTLSNHLPPDKLYTPLVRFNSLTFSDRFMEMSSHFHFAKTYLHCQV